MSTTSGSSNDAQALIQAAQIVYDNRDKLEFARFLYNWSWLIFPLIMCLGGYAVRCLSSSILQCFGIGARYCNVVFVFAFLLLLTAGSLVFLALWPTLVSVT
jgi:hypothetical protein